MSEREDWESLILSPGWLMLTEYARRNWRENYPHRVKMAIANAKAEHSDLAAAISAIDAETDAINTLLSYPGGRVTALLQQAERAHLEPSHSRRGTL